MARPALTLEQITNVLDVYFDVEFSFIKTEEAAELILTLPRTEQDFIIDLTRRIAATNSELAFPVRKKRHHRAGSHGQTHGRSLGDDRHRQLRPQRSGPRP